jgi:prevent-host-death family protein
VTKIYSTYEAKARFSEVLRQVRLGSSVLVSYRGQAVAEIRPVEPGDSTEGRLRNLESRGVIGKMTSVSTELRPILRRRGALDRFLELRE